MTAPFHIDYEMEKIEEKRRHVFYMILYCYILIYMSMQHHNDTIITTQ